MSEPAQGQDGFQGQTFLVTGASSGIGRACAERLVGLGARVLLGGRNQEALEASAEALGRDRAIPAVHELTDMDDACAWVSELSRAWGPLRGLAHSAGTRTVLPLRMLKRRAAEAEYRLHVEVPMGLIQGFRSRRPKGEAGSIVLVSSVMGLVAAPSQASYCAAKAAMGGLVRSAALELAPEGIRVNAVAPGCVETDMLSGFRDKLTPEQFDQVVRSHPLGLGSPLDVACAVTFLLGGCARWITGSTLVVDGGYSAQ